MAAVLQHTEGAVARIPQVCSPRTSGYRDRNGREPSRAGMATRWDREAARPRSLDECWARWYGIV